MSRSLVGSTAPSRSPSPTGPTRKISAPAYYATPSYITLEKSQTRKSSFRKYGVVKESQPDKPMYDPSMLFARATDKNRWVGWRTRREVYKGNQGLLNVCASN